MEGVASPPADALLLLPAALALGAACAPPTTPRSAASASDAVSPRNGGTAGCPATASNSDCCGTPAGCSTAAAGCGAPWYPDRSDPASVAAAASAAASASAAAAAGTTGHQQVPLLPLLLMPWMPLLLLRGQPSSPRPACWYASGGSSNACCGSSSACGLCARGSGSSREARRAYPGTRHPHSRSVQRLRWNGGGDGGDWPVCPVWPPAGGVAAAGGAVGLVAFAAAVATKMPQGFSGTFPSSCMLMPLALPSGLPPPLSTLPEAGVAALNTPTAAGPAGASSPASATAVCC